MLACNNIFVLERIFANRVSQKKTQVYQKFKDIFCGDKNDKIK